MTTITAVKTGTLRLRPSHPAGNMNHPVWRRRLAITRRAVGKRWPMLADWGWHLDRYPAWPRRAPRHAYPVAHRSHRALPVTLSEG